MSIKKAWTGEAATLPTATTEYKNEFEKPKKKKKVEASNGRDIVPSSTPAIRKEMEPEASYGDYMDSAKQKVNSLWQSTKENVINPIKENVIDPVVDYAKSGHEQVMNKQAHKTNWDEVVIGATPMLLAALTGDFETGAEFAGKGLLGYEKRQYEQESKMMAEDRKLASKSAVLDKPLTKSNVMTIETEEGPKVVKIADAIGEKPQDKFELGQKKDLAKYKASLKSKENKLDRMVKGKQKVFDKERTLRDSYNRDGVTKQTKSIAQAFNKIQDMANRPQTGPNDISMIFAYMKMLDPASTVREGEQATARNSGSIPDNVVQMYNRVFTGKDSMLPATVRENFLKEAKGIYESQIKLQNQTDSTYQRLSGKYGLDFDNIKVIPEVPISPTPSFAEGTRRVQNGWIYEMQNGKMTPIRKNNGKEK